MGYSLTQTFIYYAVQYIIGGGNMCKYFDGTCNCPYRMSSVCDSPSDCEYLTEEED